MAVANSFVALVHAMTAATVTPLARIGAAPTRDDGHLGIAVNVIKVLAKTAGHGIDTEVTVQGVAVSVAGDGIRAFSAL